MTQATVITLDPSHANASMESFFATLKTERAHHRAYQAREDAWAETFSYIEGFHNRRRIHSSLGYISPLQYEQSCRQHTPYP